MLVGKANKERGRRGALCCALCAAVAIALALGAVPLSAALQNNRAFASEYTTGKVQSDTEYRLYVDKGRGNGDEWNIFADSILSVSGSEGTYSVWCVDITKLYPQGKTATAQDATSVIPQDRLTKLALAYDYAFSETNGTYDHFGSATWVQRYAIVQAYAWWVMQHAPGTGMANYTIYSIEVLNGEGGWGSEWDAAWNELNAYTDSEAPTSVGFGTVYVSADAQTVAARFSVEKIPGSIALQKRSSNASLSDKNQSYFFNRASYGVYSDEACSGCVARLTTNELGFAQAEGIAAGTYWVRELVAPSGFALDSQVYSVTVAPGKTAYVGADGTGEVFDAPQYAALDLLLVKYDSELGSNVEEAHLPRPESVLFGNGPAASNELSVSNEPAAAPGFGDAQEGDSRGSDGKDPEGNSAQGNASLSGAQFTVRHFGGKFDDAAQAESSGTLLRTWVFATDERGFVKLSDQYKVSGDELYVDSAGTPVLPLGTYVIQETSAPAGYLPSEETLVRCVFSDGDGEVVKTYVMPQVAEDVVRGDLELVKVDEENMARMAGIPFEIVSNTTGERHVIVTDENGYASTASTWAKHSSNTNANDEVPSDEYLPRAGVWFGDASALSDSRGALIYDSYTVNELPCRKNAGHDLVRGVQVSVSDDGSCIQLGTIGDKPVHISTVATDAADGDKNVLAREQTTIVDTCSFSNVVPGEQYKIKGTLMDAATGQALVVDGQEVTAETEFMPAAENGEVEVMFSFDGTNWQGGDVVIFEEMYRVFEGEDILVAEHADINSESQTVSLNVPEAPAGSSEGSAYGKTGVPFEWILAGIGVLGVAACVFAVYGTRRARRS